MDFDIDGARKAGYSDDEIAGYLGKQTGFDVDGARKAGYAPDEIVSHISDRYMRPPVDKSTTGLDPRDLRPTSVPALQVANTRGQGKVGMTGITPDFDQQAEPTPAEPAPPREAGLMYEPPARRQYTPLSDARTQMDADLLSQNIARSSKYDVSATQRTGTDHAADYVQQLTGSTELATKVRQGVDVSGALVKTVPQTLQLGSDIAQLLTGGFIGKDGSQFFQDAINDISAGQSTVERDRAAQLNLLVADPNVSPERVALYLANHPDFMLNTALPSIGSMLVGGAGGVAGKQLAARGAGALTGAARAEALSAGAERGATVANILMNAGDTFNQTDANNATLLDRYKAAAIAALGTAVVGRVTEGGAEGQLARGGRQAFAPAIEKNPLARVVASGLTTGVKEFAQESGEGFSQDVGQQVGETGRVDFGHAARQGILEGTAGAVTGVGAGALHAKSPQQIAGEALHNEMVERVVDRQSILDAQSPDDVIRAAQAAISRPDRAAPAVADAIKSTSDSELLARLDAQEAQKAADVRASQETPTAQTATTAAPAQAAPLGASIDAGARETAASPHNDLAPPSQAQIEAGNSKLGHIRIAGLGFSIENDAGSVRKSKPDAAKPWQQVMQDHYGYILGAVGADEENVDAFVKPGTTSDWKGPVFVVDQRNDKGFDEHKSMWGYSSLKEATDAYHRNYEKGWKGAAAVSETTIEDFKAWLRSGKTKQAFNPEAFQQAQAEQAAAPNVSARPAAKAEEKIPETAPANISPEKTGETPVVAAEKPKDEPAPLVIKSFSGKQTTTIPAPVDASEDFKRGWMDADQGKPAGRGGIKYHDGFEARTARAEKSGKSPAPVEKTAPASESVSPVTKPADGYRSVGRNAAGQEIFEDRNGVRSRVENGVRIGEPVRLRPSRDHGMVADLARQKQLREDDFKTASELGATTPAETQAEPAKPTPTQAEPATAEPGAKTATARPHDESASWWDGELTREGRRQVIEAAGLKIPPGVKWRFVSNENRAILLEARQSVDLTPTQAETSDHAEQLGKPSRPTLEEVPSTPVQPSQATGEPAQGTPVSSAADRQGDEGSPNRGNDSGRGVDANQEQASVPGAGSALGQTGRSGDRKPVTSAGESEKQPADTDGKRLADSPVPPGEPAAPKPRNFQIADDDRLGEGGDVSKFESNVAAITLLKKLEAEGRYASPDEQRMLAKYIGWGGLKQAFRPKSGRAISRGWEGRVKQLEEILTADEYEAANRSILDAHYTSVPVARAMWDLARRLGFDHGLVQEPSVGTGNFFGTMPRDMMARSALTGVELDSITARIAGKLYPDAHIIEGGYQDARFPDEHFNLTVGNPPFGEQSIPTGDSKHLKGMSIHNYFFARAIDKLAAGGLHVQVVSRYFMDAGESKARDYIAHRAKFIGAIRLPRTAFKATAGTEVVTDILVFQKLDKAQWGTAPKDWTETVEKQVEGKSIRVSRALADAKNIVGTETLSGSMYSAEEYTVDFSGDLATALREKIAAFPQDIFTRPVTTETHVKNLSEALGEKIPDAVIDEASGRDYGSMFAKDGALYQRTDNSDTGLTVRRITAATPWSDKQTWGEGRVERAKGMAQLRDLTRQLLSAEAADLPKVQLGLLRQQLNKAYDGFVKKHGFVNDTANERVFRDDPDSPLVAALESDYDAGVTSTRAKSLGIPERKASATKMPIFERRVVEPYRPPTKVDTPADALAVSLSEKGAPDIAYMAQLAGQSEGDVLKVLTDGDKPVLYLDPETQSHQVRDQYLSGNVKAKYRAAVQAGLEKNAQDLRAVFPPDVRASDLAVRMGAPWVTTDDYADFIKHIMGEGSRVSVAYAPATSHYFIKASGGIEANLSSKWGTARRPAHDLIDRFMNGADVAVYDTDSDGKRHLNKTETDAAKEKYDDLGREFESWLFADGDRRERLVLHYNDHFNTNVQPKYDGSYLKLPGKVPDSIIKLRRSQNDAIARIVRDGKSLLDHVVGAGKTYTVAAATMELRRTGLAKKPMITVPNHLVEQWAADFYRLYPGAKLLAARKSDFETHNRHRLLAKIATGDWDAVVMAHSSFGFIKNDVELEKRFMNEQIAEIQAAIEVARQGEGKDKRTERQYQKALEKLKAKLKELLNKPRDNLLTFQQLGVDHLSVDESHMFKNLFFTTGRRNVAGLGTPNGSKRAMDMFLKTRWLQETRGGRGVVFATGTPVSNSLTELYTVQRYLGMDDLKSRGITTLDAWLNSFGSIYSDYELDGSGIRYKRKDRLRQLTNVPEIMQLYRSFSDSVTLETLKQNFREDNNGAEFPIPGVKGGKRENVVVPRSAAQAAYFADIVHRADNIKPNGKDNMLAITTDARKAALDMRLVDPNAKDDPKSKAHEAADRITSIYKKWTPQKGTQLVFLDLSVPLKQSSKIVNEGIRDALEVLGMKGDRALKARLDTMAPVQRWAQVRQMLMQALDAESEDEGSGDRHEKIQEFIDGPGQEVGAAVSALAHRFSVYDDLREKLIDRGIPGKEIAFIHDFDTDAKKQDLFDSVKAGAVRVLLGSTEKMGAGTNVQNKLVAEHHLDCPWKPSDIEQREGRIIRQGNELRIADPKFEVEINAYATEQTYDARMWQVQEQKLIAIETLRKFNGERTLDEVSPEAATAAEMKAAASGNPLILEDVQLTERVRKLEGLEHKHASSQRDAAGDVRNMERAIAQFPEQIKQLGVDAERYQKYAADPWEGKEPQIVVDGTRYEDRHSAEMAISQKLLKIRVAAGADKRPKWTINFNGKDFHSEDELTKALYEQAGDMLPFVMTVDGKRIINRRAATAAMAKLIEPVVESEKLQTVRLGKLGTLEIGMRFTRKVGSTMEAVLTTTGEYTHDDWETFRFDTRKPLSEQLSEMGLAMNVQRAASSLGSRRSGLVDQLAHAKKNLEPTRATIGEKFKYTDELAEKKKRLREVKVLLTADDKKKPGTAEPGAEPQVAQEGYDFSDEQGRANGAAASGRVGDLGRRSGDLRSAVPGRPNPGSLERLSTRTAVPIAGATKPRPSIIGKAIADDFERGKATALTGRVVQNADDLAALAQVWRDPRYETLRVVYVDGDGKVVHATALSSRLPGTASVFSADDGDVRGSYRRMWDEMDTHGATGFYLLHNHPSGEAKPSEGDIGYTQQTAKALPGFKGHVIVNSNEFSVIGADGRWNTTRGLRHLDAIFTAAKPNQWLGHPIKEAQDLADVGKAFQNENNVGVVMQSGRGGVRLLAEMPPQLLEDRAKAAAWIRRLASNSGGEAVFLWFPKMEVATGVAGTVDWLLDNGFLVAASSPEGLLGWRRAAERAANPLVMGRKRGTREQLVSQEEQTQPIFHSALERGVESINAKAMTGGDWQVRIRALVGKNDVKADEIAWTGVEDWLRLQPGKVAKADVMAFLAANGVRVTETTLGGAKEDIDRTAATDAVASEYNQWLEANKLPAESMDELDKSKMTEVQRAELSVFLARWNAAAEGTSVVNGLHVELTALGFEYEVNQDDELAAIRSSNGSVYAYDNEGEHFVVRDENDKIVDTAPANVEIIARALGNAIDREAAEAANGYAKPGETQYPSYQLPGGQNYRELLLTLPEKPSPNKGPRGWGDTAGGTHDPVNFRAGHYPQANLLAHVRFNERTDAEGKRVLFIEEIQSDWGEQGRKRGFGGTYPERLMDAKEKHNPSTGATFWEVRGKSSPGAIAATGATREEAVSKASAILGKNSVIRGPFVENTEAWVALALKRMVRYAAENGFDRVAWTTGAQNAERYSLDKKVDSISWIPYAGGERGVEIALPRANSLRLRLDENGVVTEAAGPGFHQTIGKALADVIGKDLAGKVMADPRGKLEGDDLKMEAQGMRGFYDKIVPNVANDVLRKLGGEKVKTLRMIDAAGKFTVDQGRGTEIRHFDTREEAKQYLEGTETGYAPEFINDNTKPRSGIALFQQGFDITPALHAKAMESQALFQETEDFNPNGPTAPRRRRRPEPVYDLGTETKLQAFQRYIQDDLNRLNKVQEAVRAGGGRAEDFGPRDVYHAAERFPGMVVDRTDSFTRNEVEPFMQALDEAKVAPDELALYAYAKHAGERNEYIQSINPEFEEGNGSGMTDDEARGIIRAAQETGRTAVLEPLRQRLLDITKGTRQLLEDEGLISRDEAETWARQYENYVPLKGFADEVAKKQGRTGTGQGFKIAGKESIAALGRRSRAGQIVENVLLDRERAIVRAMKNRVGKSLLDLASANPDPTLWEINPVQRKARMASVQDRDEEGNPISDPYRQVIYEHSRETGPQMFSTKVGGREVRISLRDPLLAKAMNSLTDQQVGPVLRFMSAYNSMLSRLYTGLSPTFVVLNGFRDMVTAQIQAQQYDPRLSAKIIQYYGPALAAAFRFEYDRVTHHQGVHANESDRMFAEYSAAGGRTGFYGIQSLENKISEVKRMFEKFDPNQPLPKRAWRKIMTGVEAIEGVNQMVENATRAAAYRAARELGMSPEKSSSISKNITVNFNRRGELTRWIAPFFLFWNASVQGSATLLKAAQSRRVQAAVAMLTSAAVALAAFNVGGGGDDDDGIPYWDKIPPYEKERNLIIMLPPGSDKRVGVEEVATKGRYIKIPLPYGFSTFTTMGTLLVDGIRHMRDPSMGVSAMTAAGRIATSILNNFNPAGGDTPLTSILPIIQPALEARFNVNHFGEPLYPEPQFGRKESRAEQYYPNQKGNFWQRTSQFMNESTGGNSVANGWASIQPAVLENTYRFFSGGQGQFWSDVITPILDAQKTGEVKWSRLPFVRQLYGQVGERDSARMYKQLRADALEKAAEVKSLEAQDKEIDLKPQDEVLLELADMDQELRKAFAALRAQEMALDEDKDMPKDERRREMNQIEFERRALYNDFLRTWRESTKEAATAH